MAVIDDTDDAEKAVKDLTQAGFHAEDIKAMHGEEAEDQLDIKCKHCNLVKRLTRFEWTFVPIEGRVLGDYSADGKAGHHILGVHVHEPDDVKRVCNILEAHHGHHIEQFGHMGTTTEVTGTRLWLQDTITL